MTCTYRQTIRAAIFACVSMITVIAEAAAQSAPRPPAISTTPSEQPRMTARQEEIIRIVRSSDGYITKELHDEFWSSVPFTGRQMDQFKDLLASTVEKVIGPAQTLGYETWHSALLSLRAARVVRSEGLDPAIQLAMRASSLPSYRNKMQESVYDIDRILTAAADGTPLQTKEGPIFVNEDMIAATLAGIEGGTDRFKILIDPTWNPSLRYFEHPKLHISVLAPWPFTPSKSVVTLATGMVSDFYKLEQSVSDSQFKFIGFASYSEGIRLSKVDLSDPTKSVLKNVESGLKAVGATPATIPRAEVWRGRVSAEGSGYVVDPQAEGFVALRSVYLSEHEGFLVLTATSLNSLSDAQAVLDELEQQTQILR